MTWKLDKKKIKTFPNKDPEESLEILRKFYLHLKEHHFELPKLKKKTFRSMAHCSGKNGNGAHCHRDRTQICFNPLFLRKRAGVMNLLGYKDEKRDDYIFLLLRDTMAFGEILTHEVAHFRNKGVHNKRFYTRQHKLFDTFINGVINGEIYG